MSIRNPPKRHKYIDPMPVNVLTFVIISNICTKHLRFKHSDKMCTHALLRRKCITIPTNSETIRVIMIFSLYVYYENNNTMLYIYTIGTYILQWEGVMSLIVYYE